ncbi:MAG: DoxX family protein [Pseudomonadota bacterium]
MTSSFSIMIGRFLLGLYFFVPGITKFTQQNEMLDYMQANGVPLAQPLLWFAGIASLIGGLMLMSGRYVKFAAFGFVIYVLLVNFMMHDFWAMSEDRVSREMQNFIKNLGIMAGLLVLAGYATWRAPSLDGWWRSDASKA